MNVKDFFKKVAIASMIGGTLATAGCASKPERFEAQTQRLVLDKIDGMVACGAEMETKTVAPERRENKSWLSRTFSFGSDEPTTATNIGSAKVTFAPDATKCGGPKTQTLVVQ